MASDKMNEDSDMMNIIHANGESEKIRKDDLYKTLPEILKTLKRRDNEEKEYKLFRNMRSAAARAINVLQEKADSYQRQAKHKFWGCDIDDFDYNGTMALLEYRDKFTPKELNKIVSLLLIINTGIKNMQKYRDIYDKLLSGKKEQCTEEQCTEEQRTEEQRTEEQRTEEQ